MQNKKGFIFDFDGVIIDTEKYHYKSWAGAFASVGFELSESEYQPLKSIGRDYIMTYVEKRDKIAFTAEQKEMIVTKKDEQYQEFKKGLSTADAVAGVLEYIDFLKTQGVKTAVASSSIEAGNIIREFKLQDKFDVVCDGTFGIRRKPQPDMFLYCAKKLGLKSCDCVVFEDSGAGVKASENAGMDCVYIGETENHNANLTIENFEGFRQMEF